MKFRSAAVVVALSCLALLPAAQAQNAPPGEPPSGLDAGLEQQVRQLALESTHPEEAARVRVEVVVGQLDPRLRLAPCQRVDPYVPDGMRLWGKSRIGLRCTQGTVKWNVYLPITVKVWGTALVATNGGIVGTVLTPEDLTPAEVDLAEDTSVAVANPELAVGRVLARPLKPGQSLRVSHLKVRQFFSAGETVSVIAQGDGFSVASEGQALNNGYEGQAVRVRTEGGRVVTGQAVGEHRVEMSL